MNCDPELFSRLAALVDSSLELPVTATFEPGWMGSGLGFVPAEGADFDVCTTDPGVRRFLADDVGLRLGDLVCVQDHWCAFGFTYYKGAVTVGVIIHCDSLYAGHGPGVRVIATSQRPDALRVVHDADANLLRFL